MDLAELSVRSFTETVASDAYNIKSIPSSLLVDPEGTIVARDLRGEALGAKLEEIFGK